MPDSKRPSPPYGFAALIALALLLLYIATLAPSPPPRYPALRAPRPLLRPPAAGELLRGANQPLRRRHQRPLRGALVPGGGALAPQPGERPRAPARSRGGRRADRRHLLDRLEPVDREREGVHRLPPLAPRGAPAAPAT